MQQHSDDMPDPPARRLPPLRSPFVLRASATYGTAVLASGLSLVNVLVTARALGPTGRGDVAFLTTMAVLSSNFVSFGLEQSNSNLGGREPESRPALATNSLVFSLAFAALAAGVVVLLVHLVPAAGADSDRTLRWAALGVMPFMLLSGYLVPLAQASYRFAIANVAALTTPAVTAASTVGLAAAGELTVGRALAAWIGGQLLTTAILCVHLVACAEGFGRPDPALGRRMLAFGVKAQPARVMGYANYRLDQWLVGALAGPRELGLYSVAVAWSEGLFFLPNALASVQRPDLVRATREQAYRRALRVHNVAQLLTLVLALGLLAVAGPLTEGVFGDRFAGSAGDLRVLALGGFGIVTLKQLGDALTAQRMPGLEAIAMTVAFLATLALDLALIPPLGGLGAAAASTLSYSAGGVAVWLIFRRTLGGARQQHVPRSEAV